MKLICACLLVLWTSVSIAGVNLKPFQSDSLEQILDARHGQGFILLLWSIDCPPCLQELAQIQQLQNPQSKAALVLIATDDARYADSVQQVLTGYQLQQMDNWIFTDPMPERLRQAIDPAWYGELPRAYYYDAAHRRSAHSGSLSKALLQQWLNNIQLNPASDKGRP